MAGAILPNPGGRQPIRYASAPDEDVTAHPMYQLGVQHAHTGIAPNPFAGNGNALDAAAPGGAAATLPRAPVAARPAVVAPVVAGIPRGSRGEVIRADGQPHEVVPGVTDRGGYVRENLPAPVAGRYPSPAAKTAAPASAADAYIEAQKPVLDQQARKAAGVSEADWKSKPGGPNDPFTNGFFKSAPDRAADLNTANNDRLSAGRNLVAGIKATQNQNRLATLPRAAGPAPAVGGTQAILTGPGTRQPVIAGAAGDVTSQFADRTDPSLDKNYLAGKDKATIAAALPRARKQSAVIGAPDSRDFWAGRAAA